MVNCGYRQLLLLNMGHCPLPGWRGRALGGQIGGPTAIIWVVPSCFCVGWEEDISTREALGCFMYLSLFIYIHVHTWTAWSKLEAISFIINPDYLRLPVLLHQLHGYTNTPDSRATVLSRWQISGQPASFVCRWFVFFFPIVTFLVAGLQLLFFVLLFVPEYHCHWSPFLAIHLLINPLSWLFSYIPHVIILRFPMIIVRIYRC